jgi:hypothetical protein
MKLWSDYEGRTIAEVYPLKKLVRPEGRSAFFLTTNGTGTPALVRIIEAHFDESEILKRWKTVSEIGQENLITMRKFGETELDGTPLVYAVMEPTEISLAELLQSRTLTAEETRDLAHSLVAAIEALHSRDLIHGQIDPESILAAGETVKLRSDCVREVVNYPDSGDPTLAELKAQDAHALAVVLLQALTGRTSLQGSATLLPSPFDGIIRNGLSGRWGLKEMSAALGPVSPRQAAAAAAAKAQATAAATPSAKPAEPTSPQKAEAPVSKAETATTPASVVTTPAAKTEPITAPAAFATTPSAKTDATAKQENLFAPPSAARPAPLSPIKPTPAGTASTSPKFVAASLAAEHKTVTPPAQAPDVRHRIVQSVEEAPVNVRKWLAIAAGVLILLVLGWRMLRTEPTAGASRPVTNLATPDANSGARTPAAPAPSKPSASRLAGGKSTAPVVKPAAAPVVKPPHAAAVIASTNTPGGPVVSGGNGAKNVWRVVAFTYNHEDQAQQKAQSILKQHPGMNAEVFSPSGKAPYLVTLGGPMSREAAEAFKSKVRGEGLPHDTYTQNYSR